MKNIIINKEFSITGNKYLIDLNSKKTNSTKYLNQIFESLSLEKIKSIKEYFVFLEALNCNSNFYKFLSNKNKKDYLAYLKEKIKTSEKYDTEYFSNILPARENLLSKLKILDNCNFPVYKHNSATGRSKIINGTNFMTMKKEKRKNLKYKNYHMFEIDFNSCEPYFYLLSNKMIKSNVTDVYQNIQESLDISGNDRKSLKTAVISVMYGAQYNTVKRLAKISKIEYKKLLDFLKIKQFSEKLNKQVAEKGYILNYYNRPVLINNPQAVVNYWVQSSVADFCYLSFDKFVSNYNINFHAIIHDAILCSATKEIYNDIKINKYLTCPVSSFKIPVSFSNLKE